MVVWKSLSLAINWINLTVLITKIYNLLLPTAVNLNKWNWKYRYNSTLCKQKETMEPLIQCPDPSQNDWRIKYISKLCQKLGSTNTDDALTMNICTIIIHWMDTGLVIIDKFLSKYSKAIYSQYTIGWDHFFHGKISHKWLQLYEESR